MVLKELCAIRGVSGDEKDVRNYIIERAEKLADEVKVDRMGNVLAIKKPRKTGAPTVMLDAHMDEVGMIVVGINENGLLSYACCGGIDARVIVSKKVLIGDDKVPGVIGAKAIHLQSAAERTKVLGHDQLYIDIGASDKASAERLVKPGDFVAFDSDWVEFGDGMVKTPALDDRVGCYTMLRILENEYDAGVVCSFSVQEEVGLRGARPARFNVDCDYGIALEGTAANDMGMVDDHYKVTCVGKGVAISFMDRTSIGNVKLFGTLRDVAEANGIAYHIKNYPSGGNNASCMQTTKGPIPTCVLSVPCRYIHSPSCVAKFSDIDCQYELVNAFLKSLGDK